MKGKRCELGIGPAREVSLRDARDRAHEMRKEARAGRDPTAARNGGTAMTFEGAATLVHAEVIKGWKNSKHQDQWINTLKTYVFPTIGPRLAPRLARSRSTILSLLTCASFWSPFG